MSYVRAVCFGCILKMKDTFFFQSAKQQPGVLELIFALQIAPISIAGVIPISNVSIFIVRILC